MKVGIVGAGQLARMLAQAGKNIDVECHCIGGAVTDSASSVAKVSIISGADESALRAFSESVDVVTFENENVDGKLADCLAQSSPLHPGVNALALSQDRLHEKQGLLSLDIPVAPYAEVNSKADLLAAVKGVGLPCIVKTRRFGYDGKGQFRINVEEDVSAAWEMLGEHPLVVEGFVDFSTEVSIIAVRGREGEIAFYPLTENIHEDGILRVSKAPYDNPALQLSAEHYAKTLMNALSYVGVLAIEFFVTSEGLIVNEFAPRVHNSGHWTIEGAETSQFENHLRAVCGLPLGVTAAKQSSIMINCIGQLLDTEELQACEGVYFHDYEKAARPGRKVGHVTVVPCENNKKALQLVEKLYPALQIL